MDGPGWQWVFLLNVPIGLVLFALALRLLPESRDASATRSFVVGGRSIAASSVYIASC